MNTTATEAPDSTSLPIIGAAWFDASFLDPSEGTPQGSPIVTADLPTWTVREARDVLTELRNVAAVAVDFCKADGPRRDAAEREAIRQARNVVRVAIERATLRGYAAGLNAPR